MGTDCSIEESITDFMDVQMYRCIRHHWNGNNLKN